MNRPLDEALSAAGIALPASKNQLKRLGVRLVAGSEEPADWALYAETVEFFDVLQTVLAQSLRTVPWGEVIGRDVEVNVVGRAKTLDTLLQKLERRPQIGLANVRDVAGVRLVADITLAEQDQVVEAVGHMFGVLPTGIVDRRAEPESGYRAVHLVVPVLDVQVELQVRTRLQHLWAEVFEKLADSWGRQIRYGGTPNQARPADAAPNDDRVVVIAAMQALSEQSLAAAERSRSVTHVLRQALEDTDSGEAAAVIDAARTVTPDLMPGLPAELAHPDNLAEVVEWQAEVGAQVEADVEKALVQLLALLADEEAGGIQAGYPGSMEEGS